MASPAVQDALKAGFGEAVVVCDIPKPCKFPSPDTCRKRFLWAHKEVDLSSLFDEVDRERTSLLHESKIVVKCFIIIIINP